MDASPEPIPFLFLICPIVTPFLLFRDYWAQTVVTTVFWTSSSLDKLASGCGIRESLGKH